MANADPTTHTLNNPAGRLLLWIDALKASPELSVENTLYRMWDLPQGEKAHLLFHMSRLLSLPFQIRESVTRQAGTSAALYLKWAPDVERLLSTINLGERAADLAARFKPDLIYGVEICSDCLSNRVPEKMVTEDVLKVFGDEVQRLIEQVLVSQDLASEMRRFLLRHLTAIQTALREYRLSGIIPLEAALDAAFGSIVTNREQATRSAETREGRSVWDFIGRTAAILGVVWTTMQIGGKAADVVQGILLQTSVVDVASSAVEAPNGAGTARPVK